MNEPAPPLCGALLADTALDDLLVLDLTRVLAGPYGTMILADFGASVIKIEQPGRGDESRAWGPPFAADGQSTYFLSVNRNKRSVTLDLKTEAGREVLRDLARRADVLIENFKVDTMAGFGLGYDDLRSFNRGLIYCAITGYGQTGPSAAQPGYDAAIQAEGGIMSITGPAEGEPFKVGVAAVDVSAGLFATISILAALHHRERTGEGQFIDVALFDAQLGWLINVAQAFLITGDPPRRYGNAHPTIVPYQVFPTRDGWLMLAVGNDGQFASLCRVIDRPEWTKDPNFATNPARVVHRDSLIPQLEAIFRASGTRDWVERLLAVGVPAAPVNDVPAAFNSPQAQARGMVQTVADAAGSPLPLVGPVPKMSATPPTIRSVPPTLGEHTDEVLRDVLGYDAERIQHLRDTGALGAPEPNR